MSLDPALSHVSCAALYPSCGPEGPWLYGDLILPDKKHMTPGSGQTGSRHCYDWVRRGGGFVLGYGQHDSYHIKADPRP